MERTVMVYEYCDVVWREGRGFEVREKSGELIHETGGDEDEHLREAMAVAIGYDEEEYAVALALAMGF
jgi:hypothetical protein